MNKSKTTQNIVILLVTMAAIVWSRTGWPVIGMVVLFIIIELREAPEFDDEGIVAGSIVKWEQPGNAFTNIGIVLSVAPKRLGGSSTLYQDAAHIELLNHEYQITTGRKYTTIAVSRLEKVR